MQRFDRRRIGKTKGFCDGTVRDLTIVDVEAVAQVRIVDERSPNTFVRQGQYERPDRVV